ncbi:MAG: bifunctional DNA-formamidopyrimidine glycosylase/DNA-(apurinic or apyrimidinic site) lyase [Patescibacteria group bacterium]
MPELPEVETTVNGIKKHLVGLTIEDVWTDYNSPLHTKSDNIKNPEYFKFFKKEVIGAGIADASRRGKNILVHLSGNWTILIHMKMTGHVMYGRYEFAPGPRGGRWVATEIGPLRDDPFNRFVHFIINFSNGESMALADMRKFAKVTLVKTNELGSSPHLSAHGPEPLDKSFTVKRFKETLCKKQNSPVKTALINHEVISGIGNIYSDEILWRAGIHPLERVKNIPDKKWPAIWKAMKETLLEGIDFGGDSMSDYRNIHGERGKFQERHNAYRRTGEKCKKPSCGGVIARIKVGGRSAHFCDRHQKPRHRRQLRKLIGK